MLKRPDLQSMPGWKKPQSPRSKTFLPNGVVDSDTALVLVNAIYFKGLWKEQFNPDVTSLQEFRTSKESSKAGLDSTIVDLSLPRFKIEYSLDLKKTLYAMGVRDLFADNAADLSGIDGKRDLVISAAVHKAFVEVNEEGTEAAAATGMVAMARCAIMGIPFSVDHPFMYFIRSHDPDVILFAGSVRDV
ncbi:hypothetical protein MTO96_011214 [Rhipicephalus appendiculatus]